MNYREALDYIYGANQFNSGCGFDNAKELLERIGNPQDGFKSIHIAGTNGKGSTTSMLANILKLQGYKVGMFISPHLEDFTERIQIDFQQIDGNDIGRLTLAVKDYIDAMVSDGYNHPRGFEIITAIGFQYFAEQNVDYVVVETGLGGKLDATNTLIPELSIITSISHDHVSILGDDIGSIALEKAGIIKPRIPVVIYPQADSVYRVIEGVAKDMDSPIYAVDDAKIEIVSSKFGEQIFNFAYGKYNLEEVAIHLTGRHQILNATTVIMATLALKEKSIEISEQAIVGGLETARWAGRLERLRKDPDIIVDGAHNVASARVLADAIGEYYSGRQLILVIGMLDDKEVDKILKILCPIAHTVIFTQPHSDRAVDMETLFEKASPYCSDTAVAANASEALDTALSLAEPSDVIVFSGSLYLIGEIRKLLNL